MADVAKFNERRKLSASSHRSAAKMSMKSSEPRRGRGLAVASRFRAYLVDPVAQIIPVVFAAVVAMALIYGWRMRSEGHLTAETGLGYWLGIAGALSMLMLLLYPLRKRLKSMRVLGTVAGWFRLHMILGVIGPILILFHANFKLGSLNSAVALLSMLAVAASGLIGRYFYSKIHLGLYGKKAELNAVLDDAGDLKAVFGADLAHAPAIHELLKHFERQVLTERRNILIDLPSTIALRRRTRKCRRQLVNRARWIINKTGRAGGMSWWQRRAQLRRVEYHLDMYFGAVRKAARLAVYERLFGLWHILHLPLFFILVIAAVVHIIAVHLY